MSRLFGTAAAVATILLAVTPSVAQMTDAEIALKPGGHDEALGYVDTVLKEKPGDAKALELKGSILVAKFSTVLDLDGYAALLERAVESHAAAAAAKPKRFDKLHN